MEIDLIPFPVIRMKPTYCLSNESSVSVCLSGFSVSVVDLRWPKRSLKVFMIASSVLKDIRVL